ncbi:hypothetical protein [Taklimakanibacter albus]|uniref:Uncharacterized protein n=1 Tax=Taklimakanibacter albus TaxID=2800327 RepID=A0ACC5R1L3_9HYPH|nr:hypothetical protein [Aestuariivirga sp. YIM B02566]MBK1866530.1 hypothetical protein [Aestuariivirga sp. YIM B02566]
MRRAVVIGSVSVLTAAAFGSAELFSWDRPSEKELKEEVCNAFSKWLKENEQSSEFKVAEKKSPGERTIREQTAFDAVVSVRAGMKKCDEAT